MAKRVLTAVSKMPSESCAAGHGFGTVRMTAHFHSGDTEFEVPCWECFGHDVAVQSVQFPTPSQSDNA